MWIIKWILGALILLLIIGFAMQNTEQMVSISFIKWESQELPLWVFMYISFGVGMVVWLIFSIFRVVRLKAEVRRVKKENKRLKEELDNLRNVSIEEETELGIEPLREV
jgi:uncharacterized integral membrane protein